MKHEHIKRIFRDCDFNIIPGKEDTKTPHVLWTQWQTERIDAETLCLWGKKWPGCNWLIICGAKPWSQIPGVVVLDADDETAIKIVLGNCPPTPLITTTPRGGRHYFYRHPGGRVGCRNGLRPKLDRKSDGGYVLAPGSMKLDGGTYIANQFWTPDIITSLPVFDLRWIPEPPPQRRIEMTPARMDALDTARSVNAGLRCCMAQRWLGRQPGTQQGKKASAKCYAIAIHLLFGFGLEEDEAIELLGDWGRHEDQKDEDGGWMPWTGAEIRHKVRDAGRAEYEVPGDLLLKELKQQRDEQLREREAKVREMYETKLNNKKAPTFDDERGGK